LGVSADQFSKVSRKALVSTPNSSVGISIENEHLG
jgi:hypothetical protein